MGAKAFGHSLLLPKPTVRDKQLNQAPIVHYLHGPRPLAATNSRLFRESATCRARRTPYAQHCAAGPDGASAGKGCNVARTPAHRLRVGQKLIHAITTMPRPRTRSAPNSLLSAFPFHSLTVFRGHHPGHYSSVGEPQKHVAAFLLRSPTQQSGRNIQAEKRANRKVPPAKPGQRRTLQPSNSITGLPA